MSEQTEQKLETATFNLSCEVRVTYELTGKEPAIVLSVQTNNPDGSPLSKTFSAPATQFGVGRITEARMVLNLAETVEQHLQRALPEVAAQIAGATFTLASYRQLSEPERGQREKKAFSTMLKSIQKTMKNALGQKLERGPKPKSLSVPRIKRTLKQSPYPRKTRLVDVAAKLGVNRLTIIRALQRQGTSWKSLKKEILTRR